MKGNCNWAQIKDYIRLKRKQQKKTGCVKTENFNFIYIEDTAYNYTAEYWVDDSQAQIHKNDNNKLQLFFEINTKYEIHSMKLFFPIESNPIYEFFTLFSFLITVS